MRDPVMEAEYRADIKNLEELKVRIALRFLPKEEHEAYIALINQMIDSSRYALSALSAGSFYWSSQKSTVPMDPQSSKYLKRQRLYRPCQLTERERANLDAIIRKVTAAKKLTEREEEALRLVVGEGFSQEQAGEWMGYSQSTVSRILAAVKKKLGAELGE